MQTATVPAFVTYRVKVRTMTFTDGAKRSYIDFKKKLSRADCNLKPHQHDYYNCDLFPAMLNNAHRKAIGDRDWQYLDALPPAVKVDTSGFLAEVTVALEL